jgi:outer membrane biosynthesis protein TonB
VVGNPLDAARLRNDKQRGTALAYSAVTASKLDHGLEFTNAVLPLLPANYPAADGRPVKVFVTFYVDEQGKVRVPNVESAAAPQLIPGAIHAVLQWSFKPPVMNGKPVLVFAGRSVGFVVPPK